MPLSGFEKDFKFLTIKIDWGRVRSRYEDRYADKSEVNTLRTKLLEHILTAYDAKEEFSIVDNDEYCIEQKYGKLNHVDWVRAIKVIVGMEYSADVVFEYTGYDGRYWPNSNEIFPEQIIFHTIIRAESK